jgi:hypothetical protein
MDVNPQLVAGAAGRAGYVVAPLFVMQPAMGAGIAGLRTPSPGMNRLQSLANHAVFGLGLYLAAVCIEWAMR